MVHGAQVNYICISSGQNVYEKQGESASVYQKEYYFVSFCDDFHDWR